MPPKTRQSAKDVARVQAFGARVRAARSEQGLTQEVLAERAEITTAEVGAIERAEREVGIVLVWRLADGLGVTVAELTADLD